MPRSEFARQDWYDVWFPTLSPSAALVKQAHEAKTAADWNAFFRHYKAEMKSPDAAHALDLRVLLDFVPASQHDAVLLAMREALALWQGYRDDVAAACGDHEGGQPRGILGVKRHAPQDEGADGSRRACPQGDAEEAAQRLRRHGRRLLCRHPTAPGRDRAR